MDRNDNFWNIIEWSQIEHGYSQQSWQLIAALTKHQSPEDCWWSVGSGDENMEPATSFSFYTNFGPLSPYKNEAFLVPKWSINGNSLSNANLIHEWI